MQRLRTLPAPAKWILVGLALLTLSGAGATAAQKITGRDVADSSLTGRDIRNSSLTGGDVKNSSLGGADIKNRSLTARDFAESIRGPQGPPGQPGPPGPTELETVKRVAGALTPVPAGDGGSPGIGLVTAQCPDLHLAISGGYEVDVESQTVNTLTFPIHSSDTVDGWGLIMSNLAAAPASVRAIVFCARAGRALTALPSGYGISSARALEAQSAAAHAKLRSMTRRAAKGARLAVP